MTPKFDSLNEGIMDTIKPAIAAGAMSIGSIPTDSAVAGEPRPDPQQKVEVGAQNVDIEMMKRHLFRYYHYLMSQENAGRTGRNPKTGRWFPHKSAEGGLRTLGYGHKFSTQAEQDAWYKKNPKGMTDHEIGKLMVTDIQEHSARALKYIDNIYGKGTYIKLPIDSKLMLIDMEYTPGLSKFPKFAKAVVNGDWKTAKAEYKRYMGKKELARRNNAFFNLFLKDKKTKVR